MAKLIATHAVQARHLTLKSKGALTTVQAAGEVVQLLGGATPVARKRELAPAISLAPLKSLQQHLIEKGPLVSFPVLDGTPDLPFSTVPDTATGQPHIERLLKAEGSFVTTVTPPFVNRIEAPYQRYRENLGTQGILALDALYEMGARALGSSYARLTSKYDPNQIDAPGHRDFSHMSEAQRQAYGKFQELWEQLDEELRRIAFDLVFEMTRPDRDKPLTVAEAGRELVGYRDERRAIGAAVAGLRLLAARILHIMRSERRYRAFRLREGRPGK